jgi:toxin CcdB
MEQFTLFKNENKASKKVYPYLVNVQNDILDELNSRIVIPLSPYDALDKTVAKRLCPILNLDKHRFVLLTHQMTSVPKSSLKQKVISFEKYRYEILGAIDLLLTGI